MGERVLQKMEQQKVGKQDYEFLCRVVSVQHALTSSSADPVVLRRVREGADFEMNRFGGMYYNTCGDEELARNTIKKRIETAESDIRGHFILHKQTLEYFLKMDGAIIADDREYFAENCAKMCEKTLEYVELVKKHIKVLGESSFLFYPSCPPDHYFHVLNGLFVKTCFFNFHGGHSQATSGLQNIMGEIINFKMRPEKLPYISLPLNKQDGSGLFDINFRKNLVTNKLLLERAGLTLSEK